MEESQKTKREESKEKLQMDKNGGSSNGVTFKFNVSAPEFVSRSRTQMLPVSTYYYPFFHYLNGGDGSGGGGGFDWFFVGKQEPIVATYFIPNHNLSNPNFYPKNVLTDELRLKIIKQVVSDDGKKVKRKHPFTKKDKEEVQRYICDIGAQYLIEDCTGTSILDQSIGWLGLVLD
ncbi:hypothetical protein Gotri_021738 [Gossypium trilobum]|uniref:Uncharacterized protein n=1 Tax=Gossypium trilobum TaxID=34281 RepID=A0A7J9DDI4_9ROSI|nr:hypothetical protein [Gossypium trilobum]